ncbi:cytochrome P450 [Rhodococcus sp. B50]|uniref:cytochrome P450 n=1 Tax=Rhodococcus sp. B50 TaxID=2682847 RepID=UPI001BD2EC4C|nr:cytochrome P450 [Rhodococcus sp. B50]MBS9376436.1 Cytochrome P450 130 [Rhodococcus sp. B50]
MEHGNVTTEDFNPLSAEVAHDPFGAYGRARESCPVHHTTGFDPSFYSLTRFADITAALNDAEAETWSARTGSSPQFNPPIGFNVDGAESREFRTLFRKWLSPSAGAVNAELIDTTINELIDSMTAGGRVSGDFATEFAVLLPIRVIAHLIGVPPEDAPLLKEMTDEFLGAFDIPDPRGVAPAVRRLNAYFAPHLEHRRELLRAAGITEPDESDLGDTLPDDLLSYMLAAHHGDRRLTSAEIGYVLATALTGGNDTTTSMLTNVVLRLLEDPARWQRVVEDGKLVQIAIEESLRLDPPVLGLFRTTARDTTVDECPIPAGSKVMLLFGSGNRDPRKWDDPDEFDLDRPRNELRRHLAFGFGPHFCLGAQLARTEGHRALELLRTRLPHLRLDGPSERVPQHHLWGRRHLPVRWDHPQTAETGN